MRLAKHIVAGVGADGDDDDGGSAAFDDAYAQVDWKMLADEEAAEEKALESEDVIEQLRLWKKKNVVSSEKDEDEEYDELQQ